jgi:hypothetical protein
MARPPQQREDSDEDNEEVVVEAEVGANGSGPLA